MIVEVAWFRVDPASSEDFAPVAAAIRSDFDREAIRGMRSFRMDSALEDAGRWVVLVEWDSVADHQRFVASSTGKRQAEALEQFVLGEIEVFHYAFGA